MHTTSAAVQLGKLEKKAGSEEFSNLIVSTLPNSNLHIAFIGLFLIFVCEIMVEVYWLLRSMLVYDHSLYQQATVILHALVFPVKDRCSCKQINVIIR